MDREAYTDWRRLAGRCLILAAFALATQGMAAPLPPLTVLVDTGTEMPMAGFAHDRLVDGIHKELGEALAARLGRQADFLLLPRKRIAMALESGRADVICLYLEPWLPGHFLWSRGFFPVTEVVVTDTSVPQPHKLQDLAGQPIATILGYYYPELEAKIGKEFVREDGHSSSGNLRKLAAGRLHHVVTQERTLEYYLKIDEKLSIYPPLVVKSYKSQCAVSPQGRVSLNEVNKAIEQIVKDGSVVKIISHYQPAQK
ncbi:transporter substrate-binding domain-containing protein [Duganella sp. FT80W]|uniref:Transporter substrate-binding domain-containing protein n=1 Tax=Duganella guangzhouensis TaxID=2666084 RepID=A0A6I2L0K9_9BURK|nr:transporter substrate-binding domain-containing protein [Duganella guangzhouensis]MRW91270.1 transporter substrate-binding domain-containing protein [Duganella guangzhouensis]